jgi:hypothetical protein
LGFRRRAYSHRQRLCSSTDAIRAVDLCHRLQRGSGPAVGRSGQSLHDARLCHLRLLSGLARLVYASQLSIGTLIIGVLANILNLTGVDPFVQQLFKGALIVAAVFIMSQSRR